MKKVVYKVCDLTKYFNLKKGKVRPETPKIRII